jgi:hypothetical protein
MELDLPICVLGLVRDRQREEPVYQLSLLAGRPEHGRVGASNPQVQEVIDEVEVSQGRGLRRALVSLFIRGQIRSWSMSAVRDSVVRGIRKRQCRERCVPCFVAYIRFSSLD